MFYAWGTEPQTSTNPAATNPSTDTLIAEITDLKHENYEARLLVGASTLVTFLVEQCLSSGLGSTAFREGSGYLGQRTILAPVNQTAQYMLRFKGEAGDRIRVRVGAALTGTAAATIQLEKLT